MNRTRLAERRRRAHTHGKQDDAQADSRRSSARDRYVQVCRLELLTHPALLVVGEIGYLPVTQDGVILFFQLINA